MYIIEIESPPWNARTRLVGPANPTAKGVMGQSLTMTLPSGDRRQGGDGRRHPAQKRESPTGLGGKGGAPSRLFPPKRMSSRQRHNGSTIMGEVEKPKELYEYMGTHLEPGVIEARRELLKPASGRPVKSLPEVLREIGEALGAWP